MERAEDKPGALTKAQAKQIQNPGEDLCDLYNWYGDGQCDSFCEGPDPDCGATCLAYPTCPDGFSEVEVCSAGADCQEASICGTTILCEASDCASVDGDAIAPPMQRERCMDGYELVEFCDTNRSDCYTIGDRCGGTLEYCQELTAHCEAYPVCPEGTFEVSWCEDSDDGCFEQSLCGYTIFCAQDVVVCDAIPVCPEGYREVDECPANSNCYKETVCGTTIGCLEATATCLAYPVCPEGTQEVEACDPNVNSPCYTATMCGTTIQCQ